MNTDGFKGLAAIVARTPRKVTKLAIRQRGNKHCLYAFTGPVSRFEIGSYATFDEALSRLDGVKKLLIKNSKT